MAPFFYFCCQCNDGPKLLTIQPRCVMCYHVPCSNCPPGKKGQVGHRLLPDSTARAPSISVHNLHQGTGSYKTIRELLYSITSTIRESIGNDKSCDLEIPLSWDLRGFVDRQLGGSTDELESLVVVSGGLGEDENGHAYAATCGEYVSRFWGSQGIMFFRELVAYSLGIQQDNPRFLNDCMGVRYAFMASPELEEPPTLFVWANPDFMEDFLGLLAWIHCVIQESQFDQLALVDINVSLEEVDRASRVFSCTFTSKQKLEGGNLALAAARLYNRPTGTMSGQNDEPQALKSGPCWPPLFGAGVMANGFPVPERGNEKGVEISFDIMVTLGRINYSLELPHETILKGYSTMLIPTKGSGPDSIQWHFVSSGAPGQYLPPENIPDSLKPHILNLTVDELRSKRAFLGYCNTAWIRAGTRESGFEQVDLSDAQRPGTTLRIGREISPTVGTSGVGFFGAGVGAKFILSKGMRVHITAEESCLEDRMLNSKDYPLLLYDVEHKTGFLVPELCAVLTIAHVWASRQADREQLLRSIPFTQLSCNGGQAAYEKIFENKNRKLREAFADQKDLFLTTKLSQIFLSLEKRKEQQRLSKDATLPVFQSPSLNGWELLDIAVCQPSYQKRVKLTICRPESWHRIARDNHDMLVLFHRGLAGAIQPASDSVCPAWDPLPVENGYLLASVHCIWALSKLNGGGPSMPKMTRKLALLPDHDGGRFKACDSGCPGRCERVSGLGKEEREHRRLLPDDGAILLGPRYRFS